MLLLLLLPLQLLLLPLLQAPPLLLYMFCVIAFFCFYYCCLSLCFCPLPPWAAKHDSTTIADLLSNLQGQNPISLPAADRHKQLPKGFACCIGAHAYKQQKCKARNQESLHFAMISAMQSAFSWNLC